MEVEILEETGYQAATFGMSLSFYDGKTPKKDWWKQQQAKAIKRAAKLAHMQGGHNKFIEHIELWIEVRASLTFWKHADTYRMATKQSESTMHTLKKRLPLESKDFSRNTPSSMIVAFNDAARVHPDLDHLADALPSGFLQTRIWKMSYKTLQTIIRQRMGHRLGDWAEFIYQVLTQAERPELLLSYDELGTYDCKAGIPARFPDKAYETAYAYQYEKEARNGRG